MSKNIIIQEGGTGKQMSVSKLKTNVVGGGTCLWVPEDEASLGTKSITSNGTYNASDDGKYGYSQVTVNVPGGSGSANPDGTPSTGGGIPSSDPSSPSPSSPGGPGSGIVGTDPDSGNDYFIGVDNSGNIVTTPIPSILEMVNNPTKTSYEDGDPIDTTGAVVVAKNADGSPWTSPEYPDGIIPLNELELSTNTAEYDENYPVTATSDSGIDTGSFPSSIPISGTIQIEYDGEYGVAHHRQFYTGTLICVLSNNNVTRFISAGSSPSSGFAFNTISEFYDNNGNTTETRESSEFHTNKSAFTFDGKTVYYNYVVAGHSGLKNTQVSPEVSQAIGIQDDAGRAAWVAVYGSVSGNALPALIWRRPADNKELSAAFSISVSGSQTGGGGNF